MLEVDNISKRFPRAATKALDGVSFSVAKGEIFGLLGHNGAEKSTALGIMLGMVRPSDGEVRIGGVSVQQNRENALRKVGAIFESPVFYNYLSGRENLRQLAALSGYWDEDEVARIVDLVNLTGRIGSKVGTYSHGMRQRLGLAQALLPRPELLLLDEPTDGLDPEGILEFRDTVHRLRDEMGLTVLLNSHLLSEVELLCDRVAILKAGNCLFQGSPADLKPDTDRYEIKCDPQEALADASTCAGGTIPDPTAPNTIALPPGGDVADVVTALVSAGAKVRAVHPVRQGLEEFYVEVTGVTPGQRSSGQEADTAA